MVNLLTTLVKIGDAISALDRRDRRLKFLEGAQVGLIHLYSATILPPSWFVLRTGAAIFLFGICFSPFIICLAPELPRYFKLFVSRMFRMFFRNPPAAYQYQAGIARLARARERE